MLFLYCGSPINFFHNGWGPNPFHFCLLLHVGARSHVHQARHLRPGDRPRKKHRVQSTSFMISISPALNMSILFAPFASVGLKYVRKFKNPRLLLRARWWQRQLRHPLHRDQQRTIVPLVRRIILRSIHELRRRLLIRPIPRQPRRDPFERTDRIKWNQHKHPVRLRVPCLREHPDWTGPRPTIRWNRRLLPILVDFSLLLLILRRVNPQLGNTPIRPWVLCRSGRKNQCRQNQGES
jgi:hypothetical protein